MRRVMASFESECLSHSVSAWAALVAAATAWVVARRITHGYVRPNREVRPHG